MTKVKGIWLLVTLFLLSACGSVNEPAVEVETVLPPTEVAAVTEATATMVIVAPTETAVSATDIEPTATALPAATEAPAPTDTPEPLVMDNCMSCHSDKDMLIDTAAPEEEKEPSESSGVG